jgi:membrane associated rhomboid family serine protease
MLMQASPTRLILLGFVLLMIGVCVPFLMLLQLLESTFFLSFVSYLSSVAGLVIGITGAALYSSAERQRRRK